MKCLLSFGADTSIIQSCGRTALHLAAITPLPNSMELLKCLLSYGADTSMRYFGKTALDFARQSGHIDIAEYLDTVINIVYL